MGREFLNVFEVWADSYDSAVTGHDEEYREVFRGYEQILETVAEKSGTHVLEFGVGTGNLTEKLVQKNKTVYGVEPSQAMRQQSLKKLPAHIKITDGDFLAFAEPDGKIDSIVSTYAFHHLTDPEKEMAVYKYGSILDKGGKIVFADTVFIDKDAYQSKIEESRRRQYVNLAKDLETEYYSTQDVLKTIFEKNGFSVSFVQMNAFVWIIEAVKE
ncbi:class I SAM-dependent methyltransferase [Metabacillus sp. RGM 3146]|uniref:class I SAM-dependent methyltransferase n=1 Tax=Metabacillus sp. RGM 3146 TaxID=3401092 RepID=UPI003B9AF1F3